MTEPTIHPLAARAGRTVYVEMSGGAYDLRLWVEPDADLDDLFVATCADTGDCLHVRGWLMTVEG